ncbi:MAG: imidazole glycerol phosphate synthase cyclase subunit [Bdellovibrionota bacterium]
MKVRIIPRLDVKGDNLVKGVNMEGLRVLGKPQDFAKLYYEQGADELLLVDVVASLYGRGSILEVIRATASNMFIPLTVAGGLRTLDDITAVLRSGADKVALNSAAIRRPEILSEAVSRFGASTIVLSVEVGRNLQGGYEALIEYGRETTGLSALDWISQAAKLGIGELLITAVHREGTGQGLDIELLKRCRELATIPIIAGGGVGTREHVLEAFEKGGADAVTLAGALHYPALRSMETNPEGYAQEGNIRYLMSAQKDTGFKGISGFSLPELKEFLRERHVECRGVH